VQINEMQLTECFQRSRKKQLCNLTARQLREFALPGAIHRLIVPVVSMELSRWAAGYGAVFAK
jgi:hypothetical protein